MPGTRAYRYGTFTTDIELSVGFGLKPARPGAGERLLGARDPAPVVNTRTAPSIHASRGHQRSMGKQPCYPPATMRSSTPLEIVAPYCDIKDRLALVPPSARMRGLYFRTIESCLKQAGLVGRYRELFPDDRWSAMGLYPLEPYMLRLACAGALLRSPESVHEGMHEVMRVNAAEFATSLLGRVMLRLLSRDPLRLTEQGLAARRQTHLYGHWEIARHGPRCIEMIYREEYLWIESAIAGAARGTFEACGLSPTLETRLQDRFNGSTVVRW